MAKCRAQLSPLSPVGGMCAAPGRNNRGPVTVCSAIEGGNRLFNSSQIVECRGEAAAAAPHPGDPQVRLPIRRSRRSCSASVVGSLVDEG
jgi:hypothetical protein